MPRSRVAADAVPLLATLPSLLVLYAAARLGLEYWRERRERRRELAPQPDPRDLVEGMKQIQDDYRELIRAYERNQQWIVVRPADRELEHHHPLGHRTESMLMLPEAEWKLWLSVMQEQIR